LGKKKFGAIKMRKTKYLIALILTLTIVFSLLSIPSTAQQPSRKATQPVCGAMPNPVGVGQEVLIWLGIPDFTSYPKTGWDGLTVTVTKPDGTKQTLGPFKTDTTGSTGAVYIPTTTGIYYLQTHFPEQVLDISIINIRGQVHLAAGTIMEAGDSPIIELIVQQEPIQYYPGVSLPTEYWSRPIDAQAREWASIAGNWLAIPINFIAKGNDGPETPHILWANPLSNGGLVGGTFGVNSYEIGDAYQGKLGLRGAGVVIINGNLYFNRFQQGFMGAKAPAQQIVAVDLRTGQELWTRNNTRLDFGQIVYWDSFNLHGAYSYLWHVPEVAVSIPGTTWHAYDAFTGEWVYTMKNVPAGTNIYGDKGEILRYVVNTQQGWMALWNSTRAVSFEGWTLDDIIAETGMPRSNAEYSHGSWLPFARTIDASKHGWMWNKTIPTGLRGGISAVLEDRVIGTNIPAFFGIAPDPLVLWSISTKPGQEGTLLFNKNWKTPAGNMTIFYGAGSVEEGVFTLRAKETRQWWGFNINTGDQMWGPTESQVQLDIFDIVGAIADGKLFSTGMGGRVYAYDIKTGTLAWNYTSSDKYSEILWSNDWPTRILFITDGKIYIGHEEHSPVNPLPRGAPFVCLDTETGSEIFRADGLFRQNHWGTNAVIGDSVIATLDTYDNRVYAIGRGPTAISLSASPKVSTFGNSIILEGVITDISPGTKQYAVEARFPNGVPAVSDQSQGAWMLYVYKQFPRPMDAIGVEVMIDVVDANGNYRNIGSTTSDADGFYSLSWTPDIEGKYTVYASFGGTKSYWPSHAVTAFNVDPATSTPTPTQQITPGSAADTYLLPGIIAIIVAIAVVGVVLALLFTKKRP
jgi:outer membrane protein assembly factor BamB